MNFVIFGLLMWLVGLIMIYGALLELIGLEHNREIVWLMVGFLLMRMGSGLAPDGDTNRG